MISWRAIIRGGTARFAGGIGIFLGGSFLLAAALKGITIGPAQVVGFAELTACMVVGYVIALGLLRPALRSEAGIEGRRSVLAGFAATFAYLCLTTLHAGPTHELLRDVFAVAAGVLTTLLTFFPWISNHIDRDEIAFKAELDRLAEQTSAGTGDPARQRGDHVRNSALLEL